MIMRLLSFIQSFALEVDASLNTDDERAKSVVSVLVVFILFENVFTSFVIRLAKKLLHFCVPNGSFLVGSSSVVFLASNSVVFLATFDYFASLSGNELHSKLFHLLLI